MSAERSHIRDQISNLDPPTTDVPNLQFHRLEDVAVRLAPPRTNQLHITCDVALVPRKHASW